jgi:hypothetical protein
VVIVSYNGSGTFNINTAGQPVVTGTVISSTAFNALTADLATGLSTAITKDGQTAATARIPFAQGISSTLVTDSTSTTTGSIITAGGAGVAKALFVGTTANVAGAVTLQSTLAVGGVATYSAQPIFSSLTASSAVATDASKGLVSVTNTGTGNNVLATSPTITTPTISGDATISGLTVGKGAGAVATNTAVGASALAANTTGATNTAVGASALAANTTTSNSTAVGYQALLASTASNNTAVGALALTTNTSGTLNTAIGQQALRLNTTGGSNTAVGLNSISSNTTGGSNTAVGEGSLNANTTGGNNTAVGYQAGYTNVTGAGNTFVGQQAGYTSAVSGSAYNTCIGHSAGYSLTTGVSNTFIGVSATASASGALVTTGSKNTILGPYSGNQGGLDIRTASNHIVLSDGDGNPRGIFDSSGSFLIGKTSGSIANAGVELRQTDASIFTFNGVGIYINRITTDGTLIEFRQDNVTEGTISVSGTTVSYNGGHLSRWAQTTTAKDESLVKGTVLSNLDAMNVYTNADGNPVDNEQLNKVKVSDVEGDANVAGVFVNWDHDEDHNVDEINMAMTGDMIIRIAQGTTVARGDLLMSAGDGTAKPQGDDIVRSKTVAKVTSTHVTCTYADGSFCVPCVLMAC